MASPQEVVGLPTDDGTITRQQWKWSVLAGMASYLDAGSIVALSAGLALFQTYLNLSSNAVGVLGARIVFLHLVVVALVAWALRQGLSESARWENASAQKVKHKVRALFSGNNLKALLWTATIYLFWNIAAGTAGIFTPYIIKTLHAGNQAASVAPSC